MKGFYIEITNSLLDPKHVKKMGNSIWEYMWCLDKITSVNESGIGKVLGGKPIKWKQVRDAIGKDESTISENMNKLCDEGYINLKRTPAGNIITVNKAKKRFGQKSKETPENTKSVIPEKTISTPENTKSDIGKDEIQLRQDSKDKTNDKTTAPSAEVKVIEEVIFSFKEINPSFYKKMFGSPPQRAASLRLATLHGLEVVKKVIAILPKTNSMQYMPTITTPIQLEEKWSSLQANLIKKKSEAESKKHKVAFT